MIKIIKRIRDRINGDHVCPAQWFEQGYEDNDEGCYLDYGCDCNTCPCRFYPNFIVKIIVKIKNIKEEKYWHDLGLQMDKETIGANPNNATEQGNQADSACDR